MRTSIALTLALLSPVNAWSQLSNSPIPDFTATVLTGEKSALKQSIYWHIALSQFNNDTLNFRVLNDLNQGAGHITACHQLG